MVQRKRKLKGVIQGRSIQLEDEPGLANGQAVSVTVEPVSAADSPQNSTGLDAIKRAAGSSADDAEGLDRFLEWNRQQRKSARREMPG